MKYYTIIDTNVIISALRSSNGASYKLLSLINKKITPIYNKEILKEYIKVAKRNEKEHTIQKKDFETLLKTIIKYGIEFKKPEDITKWMKKWTLAEDKKRLKIDTDDYIFYEISFYSNNNISSDTKLITFNIKHYPIKPFILEPSEMLKLIERDEYKIKQYKKMFKNKLIKEKL